MTGTFKTSVKVRRIKNVEIKFVIIVEAIIFLSNLNLSLPSFLEPKSEVFAPLNYLLYTTKKLACLFFHEHCRTYPMH